MGNEMGGNFRVVLFLGVWEVGEICTKIWGG